MKWTQWQLLLLQWLLNHSPSLIYRSLRVLVAKLMTNASEHLLSPPQGVIILAVRELQSHSVTHRWLQQQEVVEAGRGLRTIQPPASSEPCSQQTHRFQSLTPQKVPGVSRVEAKRLMPQSGEQVLRLREQPKLAPFC